MGKKKTIRTLQKDIWYEITWTRLHRKKTREKEKTLLITVQNNTIRTINVKARIDKTQENGKYRFRGK